MKKKRDRDIALGIYGGDWRLEMLTFDRNYVIKLVEKMAKMIEMMVKMMVEMVKMIEILTSDRNNVIRVARIADQGPQDPRSLGCPVQCTMYITVSTVGDTMMFNQTF